MTCGQSVHLAVIRPRSIIVLRALCQDFCLVKKEKKIQIINKTHTTTIIKERLMFLFLKKANGRSIEKKKQLPMSIVH